jgi:ketosteroid isomerase-like protein
MSDLELAQAGLAAWRRGDFDALEELLAPEATWRTVEPGDILQTLRERYEQGFTMGPIELLEGGPGTIIGSRARPRSAGPTGPRRL